MLDAFNISAKITPNELKSRVKRFHIFDDMNGYNLLFATHENREVKEYHWYGLGSNWCSCLGLGHQRPVETPVPIPYLRGQCITKFSNGRFHMVATNDEHRVLTWGSNESAQLGRIPTQMSQKLYTPEIIPTLEDRDIIDICCGFIHTLALTCTGQVYGWGTNACGQVYDRQTNGEEVILPIKVEFGENVPKFKAIYCSFFSSLALSCEGLVYVWGDNEYHKLGLNSLKTPKVPKIIPNLVDIRTVCPLRKTTIFLDNNGFLYFCGTYSSGDSGLDNCEQCTPRKMDSDIKFSGLYCVKSEHHGYIIPVCSGTNGNTIYNILKTMQISHTEYSDIDVYYAYNMQMTRDMIDLDNVQNSIVNSTFNKLDNSQLNTHFETIAILGQGAFGTVIKARRRDYNFPNIKQHYAIKMVNMKGCSDYHKELALNETKNMIRIHFKRCVAYRSSWIEGNILYIQMDLCAGSLQNILDIKHQAFGRDFNESMNCIEYQFWCEIFRDILDAVRELHKLNPPIIHRDLKPDNILIKSYIAYDCSDSIKLSDFGLATVHDRAIHEIVDYKHSGGVGTLVYEAPEVRAGRVYTHTADIYSLAIIAEKMFDLDLCELCEPQDKYSADNPLLSSAMNALQTLLLQMACNLRNSRPECSQLLSTFNEWSIDNSIVKQHSNFQTTITRLKQFHCQFFYKYLSYKLRDPQLGRNTLTITGSTCNIKTDCSSITEDDKVVCVDEVCRCEPNYRWDSTKKICTEYKCKVDTECRDYDINRKCDKELCVCKSIYTEIPFSKKCYPKISGDCKSIKECVAAGDLNALCIKNKCRCRANFKYDENTQSSCFGFTCKISLDCQEYDKNRECKEGSCVCTDGYVESSQDNLCILYSSHRSEAPYTPPQTNVPIINSKTTVTPQVFVHTWPQKWLIMILSIVSVIFIGLLTYYVNDRNKKAKKIIPLVPPGNH